MPKIDMEFDKENIKSTLYQDQTFSNHLKSKTYQSRSEYNCNSNKITVMTDNHTNNEQMNI